MIKVPLIFSSIYYILFNYSSKVCPVSSIKCLSPYLQLMLVHEAKQHLWNAKGQKLSPIDLYLRGEVAFILKYSKSSIPNWQKLQIFVALYGGFFMDSLRLISLKISGQTINNDFSF